MRRARLPFLALVAGTALSLAACTGSPTPSGSASPAGGETVASTPAASASASASPSPSSTLATLPAKQCLSGTYTLVRFVAASNQTYGTGQGGDVTIAFDGGDYTLTGAGQKPIELTLGGNTGELTVDGTAKGTDSLDGSTATFKAGSTSGSGTVTLGSGAKQLSMAEVASVIGLEGKGEIACTSQALTITFPTVRLELARA